MDRLSFVAAAFVGGGLLLASLGCKQHPETGSSATRYQAVKAAETPALRWCDAVFGGSSPRLTLPPLAGDPAATRAMGATVSGGKRLWINLWATWCAPCLREMPLLLKWQKDLHADGVDVEVLFLSLDEDAQAYDKFLAEQKTMTATRVARVASQSSYEQWVKAYVKDPSTPIPIHLLASADGRLRCVRSGSLHEGDYPAAKNALR